MAEQKTVSMARARALCTKAELELVLWSTNTKVGALDARRLASKINRARTLRDKFRDLSAEQRRQQRGKSARTPAPSTGDNRNTREKAQLFQETLDRFQAAAARMEIGPSKPKPKAGKKSPALSAPKAASKPKDDLPGISKKTAKVAKKTARKKVAKKVAKRPAKKLAKAATPARKATKKTVRKQGPSASSAKRKTYSRKTKAKRETSRQDLAPSRRTVRGVAGQTRRNQARRDRR